MNGQGTSHVKDNPMTGALKEKQDIAVNAEFTLLDRCDRCGAEAMARIIMPQISLDTFIMHAGHHEFQRLGNFPAYDLLLCNHHTTKHALALTVQGGVIIRNQKNLVENRAQGSDK